MGELGAFKLEGIDDPYSEGDQSYAYTCVICNKKDYSFNKDELICHECLVLAIKKLQKDD